MNDRSIPFIRQYDEWAILGAAKRSTAGWRKQRYKNHTMEVPENRQYLAANSAKRNPNAPRGARFPAHPSKRDHTPTSGDNDNPEDYRIPVLPPGPPAGTGWNPRPPFNYSIHPITNPSQVPFGSFGSFPQTQAPVTPSIIPWGPIGSQSFPSSGTSTGVNYWEHPPPCTCTNMYLLIDR